nr:hypothetical protein HK105_000245 [Polyrhizophydium stewartii]
MGSICRNAESGDSFMLAPAVSTWEGSIDRERRTFGHPIADAAVAAADEARAEAIIVFTYTGDMAYFVSKRRPARPIIAITHKMYLYRRLSLLYGVFPVLSTALPADGTHLSAPLSTEQLYLRTEQDIINHGLAKSLGLSQGCTVAYCAGFHGPWPALSYSVRLSKFRTTMVM